MQTSFSPSINIIRDFSNKINYIPTPNSKRIFRQITNDYVIGTRAFNIIGSYGTGKSSFLLAFEQYLNGDENYFESFNGEFRDSHQFEFLNIIGEFSSFEDTFVKQFNIKGLSFSKKYIFNELDKFSESLIEEKKCLVIAVDEFGKFLEFASVNKPEREIYFIQQLAEFVNDISKNILLITVLHQSFDEYSRNLNKLQRQEWEKVKGRFKEITFNEPVEQLLLLGASRIENKKFAIPENYNPSNLISVIESSKVFPLRTVLSLELAKKLYPFDILAAAILTQALQFYGQNERSLFTFLESDDFLGLQYFNVKKEPCYNLASVYDYLLNNYSSLLTTKYNPHFFRWRAIQYAIDRIEATFDKNIVEATKIVKLIGLLNIFARAGSKIDKEFLVSYSIFSLGIKKVDSIINNLSKNKIIRFQSYKNQFVLFEGTDLDIEKAVESAATRVTELTDIIAPLRSYFNFPYLPANAVHYKYGTPRFFQFYLSNEPISEIPSGPIDGIINLIFSDKINKNKIIRHSKKINEAILFGFFRNTRKIKEIIFEMRKIEYVLKNIVDDKVAKRELIYMLEFQKHELNHFVLNNLYKENDKVSWIFSGQEVKLDNRTGLNQLLSKICEQIYCKTPVFKNELINREKNPSAISKARKNLLEILINNWDKNDLGFKKNEFPPEKSIYFALLKNTGIHRREEGAYNLGEPNEVKFKNLWEASEEFLSSTKTIRKNLGELVKIFKTKPYKLKKGLIDFWVPIYLFIKRNDFALFHDNRYLPELSVDIFELVIKNPENFFLKAFNIDGIKLDLFNKYRFLLNKKSEKNITKESFIETIKPFLIFFQTLPEYSKKTGKLSMSALCLREAIVKSTDPEKTFFEDFPKALGYSTLKLNESAKTLEAFVDQVHNALNEIRVCYENLVGRFEQFIIKDFRLNSNNFPDYKIEIQKRYKSIKKNILLPHHAKILSRINSLLDDKNAWLNLIALSMIGKSLEKLKDNEEEILYNRVNRIRLELDNFTEFSKLNIDDKKENVIKIEITSLSEGRSERILRIPKSNSKQVKELEGSIQNVLTKDKNTNLETLLKILTDQLKNEKK